MSLWNLPEFSDKFNLVHHKMQARFTEFFQTLLMRYFIKSIQLKINNFGRGLEMWLPNGRLLSFRKQRSDTVSKMKRC